MPKLRFVVDFKQVDREDIPIVGGKGANLGEMTKAGFPVPPGFIITAAAYQHFIDENKLKSRILELLTGLDVHNSTELTRISQQIRNLINHSPVPLDLVNQIMKAYLNLGAKTPVAVRSSATAEDLPDASFAGQQETFLNVVGEANLVDRVRDAWSSLFTPRAIFYRSQKNFDHFKVGIAIPVQKMIQSEVSGVMFTVNPVNNDKSVVVIEAVWGLGEMIVQGSVTPDHYEVLKRNFEIVKKEVNRQTRYLVKSVKDHQVENEIKTVPFYKQSHPKLTQSQVIDLAKIGWRLHQHYFFPQDVEWAIVKDKIYLIQTRPVTTLKTIDVSAPGSLATKGLFKLLTGKPASPGLVSGRVKIIRSVKEISKVKTGDVLVMEITSPDFVPAMKKAVAIVTDKGGQTSHAAIVSRELGIVCVVGTQIATKKLKTGQIVTVNGATGEVFEGSFQNTQKTLTTGLSDSQKVRHSESPSLPSVPNLSTLKTATKLYVNLAEPELAERVAAENVDGVGLLRAEFMIAQIGIHPQKMIQDHKSAEFVDQLAAGLEVFGRAFHPRPVIYRATDFRSNEYRNLKGGDKFEPNEPNPMLGFRGAARYIVDESVFELELQAINKVRRDFTNLHLMIPFVRTINELKQVKKIVYSAGLKRGPSFQLWMMAEIPANVILINDFLDVGIDGISIGTNDLTMLILGTDRDNETVANVYDEMNPAVSLSLERLITAAAKRGVASSICGQAPSLHPELVDNLVKWGITSISVAPDRIDATRRLIYQTERKLINK